MCSVDLFLVWKNTWKNNVPLINFPQPVVSSTTTPTWSGLAEIMTNKWILYTKNTISSPDPGKTTSYPITLFPDSHVAQLAKKTAQLAKLRQRVLFMDFLWRRLSEPVSSSVKCLQMEQKQTHTVSCQFPKECSHVIATAH